MCPFCDKVYDESEYSRCPYCSGELEDDTSERPYKNCSDCGGIMYWDDYWECTNPELFTEQYHSRNSIWTDNCIMNLKIDPCSYNITQLTCLKGIKSLWQSSEQLLNCQGSLIVAIPAVHSACRYLKVSHRIHSYKGSCYTAWMWYILLNELLLQQSSAVLSGRYQCVVFAYLLITPIF